jgi:hypothetical protein
VLDVDLDEGGSARIEAAHYLVAIGAAPDAPIPGLDQASAGGSGLGSSTPASGSCPAVKAGRAATVITVVAASIGALAAPASAVAVSRAAASVVASSSAPVTLGTGHHVVRRGGDTVRIPLRAKQSSEA